MDNKTKILKASLKLFIQEGFHGTSTCKITKEAGVSNGTLFYHFKTKEDLINALYIYLKEQHRIFLLENIEPGKMNKSKVKELWYSSVNWYLNNPDSVLFFDIFSNSPFINNLSKEEASRNYCFIIDMVKQGIDDELIINVEPELILHFLHSSIRGAFNLIRRNPEITDEKLDKYLDTVFKMWWRAVANI